MTADEEKIVLYWLRSRGNGQRKLPDGNLASIPDLVPQKLLQSALRDNSPLSREIRNALADWLEDEPERFFPGLSREEKDLIANQSLAWAERAKKAMQSWDDGLPFREHLQANEERLQRLSTQSAPPVKVAAPSPRKKIGRSHAEFE